MQFLAQVSPNGLLSDNWLSLIIQGGSFALIVVIVVYLWPKTQREAREEREKKEKEHREERQLERDKFAELLAVAHEGSHKRNENVVLAIKEQTVEFRKSQEKAAEKLSLTNESTTQRIVSAIATSCKANCEQIERLKLPEKPD